ncbi:hypothetical protein ABID22_003948 [Pontibacter aydingkolensis]|uniref:DUF748 domain-containing protein n=1 Tax=Pontibacter aydingkolensis TaxID=1911536 RepID=A0ABS7CXK3_9BACT|nr:hypothetical protein [Pontibacter aydingkolensis]MBW7468542.1 hypothetical protein [Pontibacter aydingkolensis]
MRKIKHKDKAKKWLIAGSVIVVIVMLLFIGQYVFTQWMEHKLEKMVQQQSDGVYELDLYGFETSPFIGSVSVDSLKLTPDYERWKQLKQQNKEVSRMLLNLKADAVTISRLSFFKMLFRKNVDLERLEVRQPYLLMTAMIQDTTATHKPLHETAKGFLLNMHIGQLNVTGANVRFREAAKSETEIFTLNEFDLTVTDYRLDSASFQNNNRTYYSQNIELNAKKATFNIPDEYFKITTDSLNISTNRKDFSARNLQLIPTLGSAAALSKAKGRAATYIKITVPNVTANGIDFSAHSKYNNLEANHILIQSPDITAFKDKKHFKDKGIKPLPHDIAQSIKAQFRIDTIRLRSGFARFEVLDEKATETGYIYFSGLNGSLTNITNKPERISRENPAVIRASALIMGKTKMEATVNLPLLDKKGYHTLKGSVASGQPQMLNPILVPTNFIKIDKGYVQSISFNATLNQERATGSMRALYDNLEIELLSTGASSGDDQGLGKKILSKAADWFIIEDSNPGKKGGSPRIADIKVTRKKNRSVLTYWKDCLASGLMVSMGLEKMAEKEFQ